MSERTHETAPLKIAPEPEAKSSGDTKMLSQTEIYLSDKTPEQQGYFREAIAELGKRDDTRHLVQAIEMYADTPNIRSLAPWQILQATRVILNPDKSKDWKFFIVCARNATEAEFRKDTRKAKELKASQAATPVHTFRADPDSPYAKHAERIRALRAASA